VDPAEYKEIAMSDQQAPRNGDTPAVAGPEGAPGTAQDQPPYGDPNDPYQVRYENLRSWTDKVAAENSELRPYRDKATELEQRQQWYDLLVTTDDADTRRQAAEALGFDLPEEEAEEPAEHEDPYETLLARQQALEQRYEQDQQTAQQAEQGQIIEELAFGRLQELDPSLPEGIRNMLVAHAVHALDPIRLPPGSPVEVLPDVDTAYQQWQSEQDALMKGWAKTKRAPYVAPGGQTATEVPLPLDATSEQRVAFAMQKLNEAQEPQ
jgi:hypothetical protein